jgi:hypothetical protein
LLVVACSTDLGDQTDTSSEEARGPAAYLAGTTSRLVTSSITGRTYQVSVAVPRGYEASSVSYPVLYSVDANGEFGIVVETARMLQFEGLVPELVIVGVGYPVGYFFDAVDDRALDLTVSADPEFREIWARVASGFPVPSGTGGAPDFVRFLTDELVPLIEAEYRVDPQHRALFGHSFGGLFAFHALLHGRGAFQRFIIASPTLAWHNRVSFAHEAAYAAAHDSLHARAFFSVGLLESDAPPDEHPWGGYITNLRDLVGVLERRSYEGFEWMVHFFEDETHNSVIPASVSKGLRYIYAAD